MAALPYIQLYVADYLADTMHLTTEEHGAYLLLIFNYWQTGKQIPKKRLASVARLSNERWNSVEDSLNEFFTEGDNGAWFHERIEQDLQKVRSKSEKASVAGRASAEKRASSKLSESIDVSNKRSNGRSNSVEQKGNHTDTDTDTDTDTEKDKKKKVPKKNGKRFSPPALEDLKTYCAERNNSVNPEKFLNHYESNGWKVGRNSMKDWKAAVRSWETNGSVQKLQQPEPNGPRSKPLAH